MSFRTALTKYDDPSHAIEVSKRTAQLSYTVSLKWTPDHRLGVLFVEGSETLFLEGQTSLLSGCFPGPRRQLSVRAPRNGFEILNCCVVKLNRLPVKVLLSYQSSSRPSHETKGFWLFLYSSETQLAVPESGSFLWIRHLERVISR